MSKVKVGDKIRNKISNTTGEVTSFDEKFPSRVWWIVDGTNVETFSPSQNLELLERKTEEETKVENSIDKKLDELKVYTGRETIEALLEGKVLKGNNGYAYRFNFESNEINVRHLEGAEWEFSTIPFNNLSRSNLTEVVTPQVGDWVRVTHRETKAIIITGEITEVDNLVARIENRLISLKNYWEILSPEQVSEYKREQVFAKVGRKLDEYRENDIVFLENTGTICMVTRKANVSKFVGVKEINKPQKWDAKVNQLTPISFAENLVSLS